MTGAWCNLASSLTTEMAARAGFDWILIDQEHGPGDSNTLLAQIQATAAWPAAPIVRIAWNERILFKRSLDLGASGVMVPYVENAETARLAVDFMRYPPAGQRGVAATPRATGFGEDFPDYFAKANDHLLTITQIETAQAVRNLDAIAAVDGVDVLFVGPLDLSTSLNMPDRFQDPGFLDVLSTVGRSAKKAGKAAGILLPSPDLIDVVHDKGFTFVAVGSDGGLVMGGLKNIVGQLKRFKKSG